MNELLIEKIIYGRLLKVMFFCGLQLPTQKQSHVVSSRRRFLNMLRSMGFMMIVLCVCFRLVGLAYRWFISEVGTTFESHFPHPLLEDVQ